MGIVVVPTYGSDPATVTAANLDAKVAGLATEFNGNVDDNNIKSAAAIANSKLNLAAIAQSIAMTAKDITEAKCADIASATTTTIWATDGNFAHITGTTTITSFGTAQQAGDARTIVFDGILTLTHNATSLILPTGANITTAAGDTAIVRAETTANARVIAYLRKDGTAINAFTPSATNALTGSVIQCLNGQTASVVTINTTLALDNSIPLDAETVQICAVTITPTNASNKLRVTGSVTGSASNAAIILGLCIFNGTTCVSANWNQSFSTSAEDAAVEYFVAAGGTGAITFNLKAGVSGNTYYVNGDGGGTRIGGGVCFANITVQEIKV